ncbi:MAG: copper resistance D family protein [Actinomycetota bacterium]
MAFEDTLRSVAFSIARFSGFTANAVLFGLVVVLWLVIRPAVAGLSPEWGGGRQRLAHRLEGIVQAALTASALATALVLVLQAALIAELGGGDLTPESFGSVVSTTFGQWYLVRIPLLAALAFLLVGRVRTMALTPFDGSGGAVWWMSWGGLALALIATTAFSGHAAVARPRGPALLNDLIHLGSGAVWFTGIVLIAIVVPDVWRGRPPVERLAVLAPVVRRFAWVALVSLTIVTVTGTLNSFFHVGRLRDLISTNYGRTLGIKIALFAVILALGAVNHFIIRRRFEAGLARGEPSGAQRIFRRTIASELAVGLAVMALTGVLTGLARTRQTPPPPPPGAFSSGSRP